METRTQEFATRSALVRQRIEAHQHWIEEKLGVGLSEAVVIDGLPNLSQVGVEKVLGVSNPRQVGKRASNRLAPLVANAEIPSQFPPILTISDDRSLHEFDWHYSPDDERASNWTGFEWQECPLALRLHFYDCTVVILNVPHYAGPASTSEDSARILITRRDSVPALLRLFEDLFRRDRMPHLHTIGGRPRRVSHTDWSNLTLDESVRVLLQNDFESFWQRQEWFKRHPTLPFRRGYLLHGPPGNGKTTAVRAMMSSRGMNAFTLRFFDPRTDDSDLDTLFERAYGDRPAIVLLEDIDRAFPLTGESRTQISLQHLLNSLHGVASGEGLVIVATANEPAALDHAILRRPGRFDRVVNFPNPDRNLRLEYLGKMNPDMAHEQLQKPADASSGFSFAQLREAYVVAGQFAFERGEEIRGEDLMAGIRALREGMIGSSRHQTSAGFRTPDK